MKELSKKNLSEVDKDMIVNEISLVIQNIIQRKVERKQALEEAEDTTANKIHKMSDEYKTILRMKERLLRKASYE
jgi:hypothetical protein